MIAFLRGKILSRTTTYVVIEVAGVGYKVHPPTSIIMSLTTDEEVSLHIYSHIREDQFTLYGFFDLVELSLFEKLLSVSGIGPRGALSMLSLHSAGSIANAVANNNASLLSSTPGIGKKTAEKMIIELKDKLLEFTAGAESDATYEVRLALETLGYSPKEIQKAVEQLEVGDKSTSTLIKEALSLLH